MIGEETEFRTVVTQGLIDGIKERVEELKQRERWWQESRSKLPV